MDKTECVEYYARVSAMHVVLWRHWPRHCIVKPVRRRFLVSSTSLHMCPLSVHRNFSSRRWLTEKRSRSFFPHSQAVYVRERRWADSGLAARHFLFSAQNCTEVIVFIRSQKIVWVQLMLTCSNVEQSIDWSIELNSKFSNFFEWRLQIWIQSVCGGIIRCVTTRTKQQTKMNKFPRVYE